jgi:hypothetical protein
MLFIEIFFIVAGTGLLVLSHHFGKRQESNGGPHSTTPIPSTASINHALKLQNSLNELFRELQSLSQGITDDLEEKLGRLKDLLQLADNKCVELSSAGEGNGAGDGRHSNGDEARKALDSQPSELHLIVEDDESPQTASARYQQIYQLADEGLSLDEIARHVQMGKGEIQLILSLRKKD